MERPRNIRLRLLSYAVIAYMMLAFGWWSVLLFTKNEDAYKAKRARLRIILVAKGLDNTDQAFFSHPSYKKLQKKYKRQEYMIMGEMIVFTISLLIGLWLINRGYRREVSAANQQRNFLLSITHELKSPLASIRLVLETLQRRQLPSDKVDTLSHSALLETDRLNKLVNDLLLSARLDDAYQPHLEPVHLPLLLEDMVGRLSAKYPDAIIQVEYAEDIAPIVGDLNGLTSTVVNLLENAVKYSLGDAQVDVRAWQEGRHLVLEVSDQGVGIPELEKTLIFDKFYRVGNEDTRKTKGTGLGLYIVNQIVKAHQGSIEVLDNQPRGTVFRVYLPRGKYKPQQHVADANTIGGG